MSDKEHLLKAVELAKRSFENGEFPAGAVVVCPDGNVFESGNSYGWNHAEAQAIDKALTKYGPYLTECTLYTTMMPCAGCLSKAYWAGIRKIVYILPKESVTSFLCYEGDYSPKELAATFHQAIELTQDKAHYDDVLGLYKKWEKRTLG